MLELAAKLRALPRTELVSALRRREFDANGIDDLFDLAEALLTNESLDASLVRLERGTVACVAIAVEAGADSPTTIDAIIAELQRLGASAELIDTAADRLDTLNSLLLVVVDDGVVTVPAEVGVRLRARLGAELPSTAELAHPAPPVSVTTNSVDRTILERLAAERAYANIAATAEVLAAISTQPARELAKGGLALPDVKRLATAAAIELEAVPRLFQRALEAGLVVRDGAYWLESDAGAEWSLLDSAQRWIRLVESWRSRIPHALRTLVARRSRSLSGRDFASDARWFHPAGGRWVDDVLERLADDAQALGLAHDGEPLEAGRLVLAGDLDAAVAAITAQFPQQVDRVYVQHDLSIVAPGPLEPSLDARLRLLADVEARDLASSYRVSAASVNRALAAGESAESILTFLSKISLTGIPQPLEYLVGESAARFGSVRVSSAPESDAPAHASVRSDDAELIGTIAVDQTLTSLGLRQVEPNRLLSRFTSDVVFWALADARYPVAAEDAAGRIQRLSRHRLGSVPSQSPARDTLTPLVDRITAGQGDEAANERAWLARQLEAAARAKETLTVSVRMPGGETSEYLLSPASVANGRLRARDQKADIERTLPLSAIASVAPAPADA